jgi:hypothetical protein
MSFTTVDTGFSERRYSFEGPDFGSLGDVTDVSLVGVRDESCATCGAGENSSMCVACVDLEQILDRNDTMGGSDGDGPDSIGGEDGDVPDSIGGDDEEDEEEDDDTESERASH